MTQLTKDNEEVVFERTRTQVFDILKKQLRPEFLNRIDDIIMFKPLTQHEILEVVRLQFEQVKRMLAENGFQINITDAALQQLANAGFDPQYGARPVKRLLQKQLLNELSRMILSGQVEKEKPITVDLQDNTIVFKN